MASSIDPTKPTTTTALTADVRANFQFAKDEIEALQAVDTTQTTDIAVLETGFISPNAAIKVSDTSYKYSGVDRTAELSVGQMVKLEGGADRYASVVSATFVTDTTVVVDHVYTSSSVASTVHASMTTASISIIDNDLPQYRGTSVISSKAVAVTLEPNPGRVIYVLGTDGGLFKAATGAAASTYSDDGGSYCGMQFIPTGGDGSTAWIRDSNHASPEMFGALGDGTTDDYTFIQAMFDGADTGAHVLFGQGKTYKFTAPVSVTGKDFTVDLNGSTLLDVFDLTTYPEGTEATLLKFIGTDSVEGTLSADFTRGDGSFTAASGSYAEGDILAVSSANFSYTNICIVTDVTGSAVTVDRPATATAPSGNNIRKLSPVKVSIGNGSINFNNRYGFGIWIDRGRNCRVHDIDAIDLGSKAVELQRSADCIVENIRVNEAFRTDAGNGYALRFAVCNDCTARNISGTKLRHTVDIAGSSRNSIEDCKCVSGISASYLGHDDDCFDNLFIGCHSYDNGQSAYAFNTARTQQHNTVQGGVVRNSNLYFNVQDGTNKFIGIRYENSSAAMATDGESDTVVLQGLSIKAGSPLLQSSGSGTTVDITFDNCNIELGAINDALGSLLSATPAWTIRLVDCTIITNHGSFILSTSATADVEFDNTIIRATVNESGSNGFMRCKGDVSVRNCRFKWLSTGSYIFSTYSTTILDLKNFEAENASTGLWRRLETDGTVKIRDLVLNGVPFSQTSNGINVTTTYGVPVAIGYTAAPANGTWTLGCIVMDEAPAAGGTIGWVCTTTGSPGTWKTWGAITA